MSREKRLRFFVKMRDNRENVRIDAGRRRKKLQDLDC